MRILIHLHELLPNSESLMAALYYAKLFDKVRGRKRGYKKKTRKERAWDGRCWWTYGIQKGTRLEQKLHNQRIISIQRVNCTITRQVYPSFLSRHRNSIGRSELPSSTLKNCARVRVTRFYRKAKSRENGYYRLSRDLPYEPLYVHKNATLYRGPIHITVMNNLRPK